jgi:hypothetical protein
MSCALSSERRLLQKKISGVSSRRGHLRLHVLHPSRYSGSFARPNAINVALQASKSLLNGISANQNGT